MSHKDPETARLYKQRYNKAYREKHRQYFRDAHNNWAKENPDKCMERRKKYLKRNKEKDLARQAVYYAVKTGKLVRPDYCSRCLKFCKPEADHHDYDKKLDITWLCKSCHTMITLERKNAILNL